METPFDLQQLHYADLIRLGKLAAEAMALSQEYDQSRSQVYCELVSACNVEMLARRRQATRPCGTAARPRAPGHPQGTPRPAGAYFASVHGAAILFVHNTFLHNEGDVLESSNVGQRIRVDGDDVR